MKLAGPAADGLFLSSNFLPTNPDPAVQKFVTEYKAKYGAVPNQFAAQAYDAMGIMLAAIKKVGPNVTRASRCVTRWPRPRTIPASPANHVRSGHPRTAEDAWSA